jgi:C1A family cysteine protease
MIKLLILICSMRFLAIESISNQDEVETTTFEEWKASYKRTYKSQVEEQRAMRNMMRNKKEIEFHNIRYKAGLETYSRGLWEQSDLSFEEKSKILAASSFNYSQQNLQGSTRKLPKAPSQVNWVLKGLVHPVENQGLCGSCFAFAAIGAVEGVLLKKGIRRRLSIQQIVDCDKLNEGCEGGDPLLAFKFIKTNGLSTAAQYPYTGRQGKCRLSAGENVGISSAVREKLNGNENRLKEIVAAYGPVAIAINAARSFTNYKSGIYNNPRCPKQLNHAMLLVGFGYDQKTKLDYWLVKNTWVSQVAALIEVADQIIMNDHFREHPGERRASEVVYAT